MFELQLREALLLVGIISGVPLLASSLVGLVSSLVQAATQIQDQTFSYLLKFSVVTALLLLFSDWVTYALISFLQNSIGAMTEAGRL